MDSTSSLLFSFTFFFLFLLFVESGAALLSLVAAVPLSAEVSAGLLPGCAGIGTVSASRRKNARVLLLIAPPFGSRVKRSRRRLAHRDARPIILPPGVNISLDRASRSPRYRSFIVFT